MNRKNHAPSGRSFCLTTHMELRWCCLPFGDINPLKLKFTKPCRIETNTTGKSLATFSIYLYNTCKAGKCTKVFTEIRLPERINEIIFLPRNSPRCNAYTDAMQGL